MTKKPKTEPIDPAKKQRIIIHLQRLKVIVMFLSVASFCAAGFVINFFCGLISCSIVCFAIGWALNKVEEDVENTPERGNEVKTEDAK